MGSLATKNTKSTEAWPRVRLGEVVVEVRDRINSSQIALGQYITTENMVKDRGGVVVAESKPDNCGLVSYKPDDILIANIRPYLKKIWLANQSGGCSSDVIVYRVATEELSPRYIYAALSTDEFFDYVMRKPRGTKMPRGDREWMSIFEIPLPQLSVQREIVARLDKELAAVDRMVKGFEAMKAEADQLFKAELKEAFEDIKRRGAETRRLGDMCEAISSRGHQIKQSEIQKVGKYIVVSQSENEIEGYTNFDSPVTNVPLVLFGDHTCVVKKVCKPFVVGADGTKLLKSEFFLTEYLYYALTNLSAILLDGEYRRHYSDLVEMSMSLISLDMQREIVAKLDAVREKCAKLKTAAEEGLKTAALMRKAILKEAFK